MNKLTITFVMLFFLATLMSGIMEGGGGMNATQLTSGVIATDTTLNVFNTNGFLKSDWVVVGDEKIRYTNTTDTTFSIPAVDGRGYDNTVAAVHPAGSMVYSGEASVINTALGFNVATAGTTGGPIQIFILIKNFFFVTMPQLIFWDFSWLKEGNMQYVRYLFMCISAGFMITMAITVLSALGGVAQAIFRIP